jgi:hypothetical protein
MKMEEKIKQLRDILEYFRKIEKPTYKPNECPFDKYDHYELSQATNGLGCWRWNCPLCGEEFTE